MQPSKLEELIQNQSPVTTHRPIYDPKLETPPPAKSKSGFLYKWIRIFVSLTFAAVILYFGLNFILKDQTYAPIPSSEEINKPPATKTESTIPQVDEKEEISKSIIDHSKKSP